MLRRLSYQFQQYSQGWVALLALIIFLLFTILVLPAQASQAKRVSGGAASPDTSFYYTADDLYQMAEAYGAGGRQAYIQARFTFDLVWPLVYSVFLAMGISWIYFYASPRGSPWSRVNLLPVWAALFDYLENVSTSLVMARYPSPTVIVASLAGVFTLVKWFFVIGSIALLLTGVMAAVWMQHMTKGGKL
jgi:hypothetical protein